MNRLILLIYVLITSSSVWAQCLDFKTCLTEVQQINTLSSDFINPCGNWYLQTHFQPQSFTSKRYTGIHLQSGKEKENNFIKLTLDKDLIAELRRDVGQLESTGKSAMLLATPGQDNIPNQKLGPKNWQLVLIGIGAAPLDFMLQTSLHESSHALFAKLGGAKINEFKPYPHHYKGNFYFGAVTYTPAEDQKLLIITDAAPMLVDASMITAYGALAMSNNLPKNRLAQLGLLTLNAGAVVDLSVHLARGHDNTDSNKLIQEIDRVSKLDEKQSKALVRTPQALFVAAGSAFFAKGLFEMLVTDNPYPKSKSKSKSKQNNSDIIKDLHLIPNVTEKGKKFELSISGKF